MSLLEVSEITFYLVEIFGLPFAIFVFVLEQRKERQGEEEEVFQRLSDEYRDFLKLVLENADLRLLSRQSQGAHLTEEQKERRFVVFGILLSLFEDAYLLVYEDKMDRRARQLWRPWEDYMREWVRRADFRESLPELLEGENEEFTRYIRALAAAEPKVVSLPIAA